MDWVSLFVKKRSLPPSPQWREGTKDDMDKDIPEARWWPEDSSEGFDLVRVDSDGTESDTDFFSSENDGTRHDNKNIEYNKSLFASARRYINPGPLFRFIIYLYGERKLLVFFWLHFVATMTIWFHFFLIKFEEQKAGVGEGAPFYWWKRIAPSLEFGTMHAILFQMALLPLTMSRYSIAALSETVLNDFVPLNRAVRMHVHLGYVMVTVVCVATIFFFMFFGILCSGGEEEFCDKFTQEIMITGYLIISFLIIIGSTSYLRHKIPYEVFYVIHHLVFLMYLVTIIHTVDSVQRNNERNRSQTFKWFSSTLLWYICDRMAMRLNLTYKSRVMSASAVRGSDGSRMLLLKLRRPVLFQFKPGQYAFLKYSNIDAYWHPFSIASDPSSRYLEFYIEVFGEDTWTGKLWDLLKKEKNDVFNDSRIEMGVMGPCGTSLGKTENFSHGLAIGAGTGIVPVLSMFKQHVGNVIRLSPTEYFKTTATNNKLEMDYQVARDGQKGSFARRFTAFWRRKTDPGVEGITKSDMMQRSIRSSMGNLQTSVSPDRFDSRNLRREASRATQSLYGVLVLVFFVTLGAAIFCLTISWNTIPIEIYDGMRESLKVLTVIFQICFAIPVLFIWDGNNFFSFIDFGVCLISIPSDYHWFQKYKKNGVLDGADIALISLLTGYMIARLWFRVVCHQHSQWKQARGMKRLEVVWVARSASLIGEIMPDINALWDSVVEKWGIDDALKVCRFSIYCTDKVESSVNQLRSDLSTMSLYQQGFVHFGRPEFNEIIENQTLEVIDESRTSNTLLAFCGSPQLANLIHQYQVSNFMLAAVTGHKKHQMNFVSETYGGVRTKKAEDQDFVTPVATRSKSTDKHEHLEEKTTATEKYAHFEEKIRRVKILQSDREVPTS